MEAFDFKNSINVTVIFEDSNDKVSEEASEENCVEQKVNVDKTLSFDKFSGYVSDPIVAPVRDSCAQPLDVALSKMTEPGVKIAAEQILPSNRLNSELTHDNESNSLKNKNCISNNNEFSYRTVTNNETKKIRYSLKKNEETCTPAKNNEENNVDRDQHRFRINESATPTQNSMLKMVSEHLLFIMNAYNVYLTDTKNLKKRFGDESWNVFLKVKYQIYALLYSTNIAILLPREADTKFVKSFLNDTVAIANDKKISCTYEQLENICNEMLIWSKNKQKQLNNIKIACDTALANASTNHIANKDSNAQLIPESFAKNNNNQYINRHSMCNLRNTPIASVVPHHCAERNENQHVYNHSMSNLQNTPTASLLPDYFAERNNNQHVKNNHSMSVLQNTLSAPLLPNYFAERNNNQHVNNHSMSDLQNTPTAPLLPNYFAEHNQKKTPAAPIVSDYCAERNNNQFVNNHSMSNLQNTPTVPVSLQTCIFSGGEPGKKVSINVDRRFLVNHDGNRSKNPVGGNKIVNCINSQFSNSPTTLPIQMSSCSSRNLQAMQLNSQQLQTKVQPLMSKNIYANPYTQNKHSQADQQNGIRLVNRNFQKDCHQNCVSHNDFHRIRPRPPPPLLPPNITPFQTSHPNTTYQNFNTQSVLRQNNNTKTRDEDVRSTSTDSGFLSPLLDNTSAEMFQDNNTLEDIATPVITHVTSLNQNVAHNNPGACHVCKKLTSHKCIECYRNYYCSTECQELDWNIHKNNCRRS